MEKHTTTADSKRADLSLPLGYSSAHSLSLSERLGVSAVRVRLLFFARARSRANFFLSFFLCEYSPPPARFLFSSHRASAAAHTKESFGKANQERVV